MMDVLPGDDLFDGIQKKASFKRGIYNITLDTFRMIKSILSEMALEYRTKYRNEPTVIPFEFIDKGEFEAELKFGGDVLVFIMHTNVFEFSREHEVMKTSYVKEDPNRSYSGLIMIFNFLADSFKYNRENDLGYLIGRIFINNESHYFIEGKREIGQLFNNFQSSVMNRESARKIIESAIRYTINFDLLTPPYENMKEVTVADMQMTLDNMKIVTGKRLGFRFQGDHDEFKS
ncbi:MAG: hypothetical protein HXX13_11555 [Bacteroidetes bacterium]|nr:hypothetical protein [Bacteroidota bacterium]